MFTGIITAVGTVHAATRGPDGLTLEVASPFTALEPGESIAVDGACLTVESLTASSFRVHVVATSLERTNFGAYRAGRRANLERAMRLGDRLGGHLVQGHVDGVGTVLATARRDDAWLADIRVPDAIARLSIPLGSIAVDGVSLTVNARPAPDVVQISLIPFTLEHTTLGDRVAGDRVHLEADMLGKYVAALLEPRLAAAREGA
ncbi:MAG TPA: riboflavin synthase [Gemmatimonadales bacterium]|nr:riboflavin synthase [Gemmatimonadales bacterium]